MSNSPKPAMSFVTDWRFWKTKWGIASKVLGQTCRICFFWRGSYGAKRTNPLIMWLSIQAYVCMWLHSRDPRQKQDVWLGGYLRYHNPIYRSVFPMFHSSSSTWNPRTLHIFTSFTTPVDQRWYTKTNLGAWETQSLVDFSPGTSSPI